MIPAKKLYLKLCSIIRFQCPIFCCLAILTNYIKPHVINIKKQNKFTSYHIIISHIFTNTVLNIYFSIALQEQHSCYVCMPITASMHQRCRSTLIKYNNTMTPINTKQITNNTNNNSCIYSLDILCTCCNNTTLINIYTIKQPKNQK